MNGFVLDAYAARSCPVKTQNHFHPAMQLPRLDDDESLHEAFLGGASFKTLTMNTLLERFAGRAVDCRSLSNQSWQVQVDAATAAMADGVDVVIGGVLPLDVPGHRSGRADLYLRGPCRGSASRCSAPLSTRPSSRSGSRRASSTCCSSPTTGACSKRPASLRGVARGRVSSAPTRWRRWATSG